MLLDLFQGIAVEIDEDGYPTSEWNAGTFGVVVKVALEHRQGALKLPQLAGHMEGDRELVSSLVAAECAALHKIGVNEGLARVLATQQDKPNLGTSAVLVGFAAGVPPRFCVAERRQDDIVLTPMIPTLRASLLAMNWPLGRASRLIGPFHSHRAGGREDWIVNPPRVVYEWGARSLDEMLSTVESLTPRVAVDICRELLHALVHLHDRGFVHGDVRPAHVRFAEEACGLRRYFFTEYANVGASRADDSVIVLPRGSSSRQNAQDHRQSLVVAWSPGAVAGISCRNVGGFLLSLPDNPAEGRDVTVRVGDLLRLGGRVVRVARIGTATPFEFECEPWWAEVQGRLAVRLPISRLPDRFELNNVEVISRPTEVDDVYGIGVIALRAAGRSPASSLPIRVDNQVQVDAPVSTEDALTRIARACMPNDRPFLEATSSTQRAFVGRTGLARSVLSALDEIDGNSRQSGNRA